jgi:hypothetical protein
MTECVGMCVCTGPACEIRVVSLCTCDIRGVCVCVCEAAAHRSHQGYSEIVHLSGAEEVARQGSGLGVEVSRDRSMLA